VPVMLLLTFGSVGIGLGAGLLVRLALGSQRRHDHSSAVAQVIITIIAAYFYNKKRKRLVMHTVRQMQKLFNQMDTDGSGDVDTTEFISAFSMPPNDIWTQKLQQMVDVDGNGFVTFQEFVLGLGRFTGCKSTAEFAFRLLDPNKKGSVAKETVVDVVKHALPDVVATKKGRAKDSFASKKVHEYLKTTPETWTKEEFSEMQGEFPGIFNGLVPMWFQFEDVIPQCGKLRHSRKLLGEVPDLPDEEEEAVEDVEKGEA